MIKLTTRQEEYLLVLATSDGQYHQLSNMATYFDVTKATASQVIHSLTEYGMIQKQGKEISITKAGHTYISPKVAQWRWISRWLISEAEMEPLMAERDASTMVCELSEKAINGIVKISQNMATPPSQAEVTQEISKQTAPFSVHKKGSALLSMGDKGFVKPATIVEDTRGTWLILETQKIKYSKSKNSPLEGALHRLWYAHNMIWVEAAMIQPGIYHIPFHVLELHHETKTATLRIRARATVGMFSMPESEALLVLDYSSLKLT